MNIPCNHDSTYLDASTKTARADADCAACRKQVPRPHATRSPAPEGARKRQRIDLAAILTPRHAEGDAAEASRGALVRPMWEAAKADDDASTTQPSPPAGRVSAGLETWVPTAWRHRRGLVAAMALGFVLALLVSGRFGLATQGSATAFRAPKVARSSTGTARTSGD